MGRMLCGVGCYATVTLQSKLSEACWSNSLHSQDSVGPGVEGIETAASLKDGAGIIPKEKDFDSAEDFELHRERRFSCMLGCSLPWTFSK